MRLLNNRYEIREPLGQGGMGVVYRAFDTSLKTEVAIKTIRDAPSPEALQLFQKECDVLVKLNHPNIITIQDIGEMEEGGVRKPFFVMPLLPGTTLDQLIRSSSNVLTVQRCVDIMSQVCRGLHAAHEAGLIHRDLKPSNIFVMPDFSIEIIDFGVAHMLVSGHTVGQKGTLLYMAPEIIQMKPPSALSDIFALGVMAYEMFTRRRPFERATEQAVIEAVLHEIPPPASDLDAKVNESISRVLHKAMAKQPWHRFTTARELADTLHSAYRGEPIEIFDPGRLRPRVERARKAFEQSDDQFALEIISEIEAEGHLDPDIPLLRKQVELRQRQKRVRQLLESARIRLDEEEYPLALQKIQEVLDLDSDNSEALGLRSRIQSTRSERQVEGWFRLARQHIENNAFGHARQALQNIIQVRPDASHALSLLAEIDRREQEVMRLRKEKELLYHDAVEARQKGEVSSALAKLEQILEIDRRSPDSTVQQRSISYQNFYNQVRSEQETIHSDYAEARKHLVDQQFGKSLAICQQNLEKYPGHALFQALKFDIEEQQRLQLSAYIAEVDGRVDREADLQRKFEILREAVDRYPDDPHFARSHRLVRDRLALVEGIIAKAHSCEGKGQFNEAIGQWETLRTIHRGYPGLDVEIDRLKKRREESAKSEAKARWVEQIDSQLEIGEFGRATQLTERALAEFPQDGELATLQGQATQGIEKAAAAAKACEEGRRLMSESKLEEALGVLRGAHELDSRSSLVRGLLVNCLVEGARSRMDADPEKAGELVQEALTLERSHAGARSLKTLLEDKRKKEFLDRNIAEIRQLQYAGELKTAVGRIDQALSIYPGETRLTQLQSTLKNALAETEGVAERRLDLSEIEELARIAQFENSPDKLHSTQERARQVAARYPSDSDFQGLLKLIDGRVGAAPASPQAPVDATVIMAVGSQRSATAPPSSPAPGPQKLGAPVAKKQLKPPAAPPAQRRPFSPQNIPKWAFAAAMLSVLAAIVFLVTSKDPPKPPPAAIRIPVVTSPGDAMLSVDGKPLVAASSALALAPGTYRIRLEREGYVPQEVSITVEAGKSAPSVSADLVPLPQPLQLLTDLRGGQVWLDEMRMADLPPNGQLLLDNVATGMHQLRIESVRGKIQLEFEIAPAVAARITKPLAAKGLNAVAVSAYKGDVHVQSTFPDAGRLAGNAGTAGETGELTWRGLSAGIYDLAFGAGANQWTGAVDFGAEPKLTVFISSGANVGTLVVEVQGADEADVILNGTKRGSTIRGKLQLSLEPATYEIRVAKEGYQAVTPQSMALRVRTVSRAAFTLVPEQRTEQAPITPPQRTPVDETPLPGRLNVEVTPPNADVTVARAGETERRFRGPAMELSEGTYSVTARAAGFGSKSETVRVVAGSLATVRLDLAAATTPTVKKAEPRGMSIADWSKPWSKDGEWFTRRGGEFALYSAKPELGAYTFTIRRLESRIPFDKPKMRWIAGYSDPRNYILFEVDKDSYEVTVVRDGKKSKHVDKKHGIKSDGFTFSFQVVLDADHILVRVLGGDNAYKTLDDWSSPGFNLAEGQFGFLLSGNDQLWLSNFSFVPRS